MMENVYGEGAELILAMIRWIARAAVAVGPEFFRGGGAMLSVLRSGRSVGNSLSGRCPDNDAKLRNFGANQLFQGLKRF